MDSFLTFLVFYGAKEYSMEPHNLFRHPENRDRAVESSVRTKASQDRIDFSVVVNFDVIAWFTHNAKLRLIANCRLRDHSRITHYPFTQSLQKLPLPTGLRYETQRCKIGPYPYWVSVLNPAYGTRKGCLYSFNSRVLSTLG